ncbi:MAG: hypothetical protein JNJ83_23545 [Verrucomicrobiaceae bacterium]|nr:hypothetical protein [Verrucomicrobiaceae bacterium]
MSLIHRLALCLSLLAVTSTAQAQSWATKSTGTTQTLKSTWSLNSTNAWAVGANGTILKWNGSAWQSQASGTTDSINGVWGTSTTNVWAVTSGGKILRYNGSSWSVNATPTNFSLNAIWGADASNIAVVGDAGVCFLWNGTAWSAENTTTTDNLYTVSGTSLTSLLVAGANGQARLRIIFIGGPMWLTIPPPEATDPILSAYVINANTFYIVTPTKVRKFWTGVPQWTDEATGVTSPKAIWGIDAANVWVAGAGGKVARLTGTTWTLENTGSTKEHTAITGTGTQDLWAVGPLGSAIRYSPATSSMFAWTFIFKPAGCAKLPFEVGTAKGLIEDTNLTGKVTVNLPGNYVTFTTQPTPGFTLSTISSPELGGLLHTTLAPTPKLDNANPATPVFGFNVNNKRTLEFVSTGSAQEPAGNFVMTSPPEGKATPVSSATGNYRGVMGIRRMDFDVATDETGKLTGVGTVEGMEAVTPGTPPTSTPDLTLGGAMTTLNGKPTGAVTGAFSGTMTGFSTNKPVTGSMNLQVPYEPVETMSAKLVNSTSKFGKSSLTLTNQVVPIPSPAGGATRTWGYSLGITEKTDTKGKKYKAAVCTLTLPTGDKILFPEKPVTFATKTGYSINCKLGVKLDPTGNPILIYDSKDKLITIPKTTLTFTGLKFTKSGVNWVPSAGTVKYTFLGQTGTGNVLDFGIQ